MVVRGLIRTPRVRFARRQLARKLTGGISFSAITKAGRRLAAAENQLARIKDASSYEEFEEAWYFFLVAAKTVQDTLEKGAKDRDPAEAWFGRKKTERRKSQLLSYFFHARNDEEHGLSTMENKVIKQSVSNKNGGITRHPDGYWIEYFSLDDPDAEWSTIGVPAPALDRGVWYEPPSMEDVGAEYEDYAYKAGAQLVDWLYELLEEAGELVD